MRRVIVWLTLALVIMSTSDINAQNRSKDGKIKFTDEQLFNCGSLVMGPSVSTVKYLEDNSIVYKVGNDYFSYNSNTLLKKPYVYSPDIQVSEFEELVPGWVNPTFSPDKMKIAYTLNNDLYILDVKSKEIHRITYDGSDLILNGYASWVYYEEIFGRPSKYRAFWWSPDSKVIAFYRFDNTNVPMFPIYNSTGIHGSLNQTRYPKAGDPNPEVRIGFASAKGGEVVWADFDEKIDQYFGTPFWNGKGDKLMVSWMNRGQHDFMMYAVNPRDGRKINVYTEHQDTWIDWMNEMLFSDNGIYIVRDFDMWQQVYYLSYDGSKFNKLTDGQNWQITILKVSDKYLFYTAKNYSKTRTDLYRINLRNKKVERVSYGEYNFANILISDDDRNITAVASNAVTPSFIVNISIPSSGNLHSAVRTVLADSKGDNFDKYAIALPEIHNYTTRDGYEIPYSVIWPVDMDPNKKYPVHVDIYGGPDHPQVHDRWGGVSFSNQWWANHGVIQVTLDNRAGGYYGKAGLNQVYGHIGDLEIFDFVDGIKTFLELPYVNADKIGIEGFSFGGTMTTLCVTEASEYFKYGIAGGGVYNWQLYDSHYTERYMNTPQDNPDGYAKTAVFDRISNYKGDKTNMLRLTHGTGDDNVHFQNTLQMVDALQKSHKDFELMIYPQGMHGYRGDQQRHSDLQDYKFWYRYLLDSDLPEVLFNYFSK